MMTEDKRDCYIRINDDGSQELVSEVRSPRNLNQSIVKRLSEDVVMRTDAVCAIKADDVSLPMGVLSTAKSRYCYTKLNYLRLNCQFILNSEKLLVPRFPLRGNRETGPETTIPKTTLLWYPPNDMLVYFFAGMYGFNQGGGVNSLHERPYLVAFDKDKRAHELPLPNLHGDCSVCMGSYDSNAMSMQNAFQKTVDQFMCSEWNSDLLSSEKEQGSAKLFKFTPEGEKAYQLDWQDKRAANSASKWSKLCTKVANPMMTVLSQAL